MVFEKVYFTLALLFISSFCPANAYLDPGTGSMIIQVLIATFAGVIYAIKLQWNNLKVFCSKLFSKKEN